MEVVEENGEQHLHVTEVKAGGLASVKGAFFFIRMRCEMWSVLRTYIQKCKKKKKTKAKDNGCY